MTRRTVDPAIEREKRRLRLRIGRLRRRLDGRAHACRRQVGRLSSWKTYVRRYPGYALLAAAGLGLTASAGLGRGHWLRLFGLRLIRRAGQQTADLLWREAVRIWDDSMPRRGGSPGTGDADE